MAGLYLVTITEIQNGTAFTSENHIEITETPTTAKNTNSMEIDQINAFLGKEIINIANGQNHTIFLTNVGELYGFGEGQRGQLGQGYHPKITKITKLKLLSNINCKIIEISCGLEHTLLLSSNGEIYSFGINSKYQACQEDTSDIIFPRKVLSPKCKQISCGNYFSIATTIKNKIIIWGTHDIPIFENNNNHHLYSKIFQTTKKEYSIKKIKSGGYHILFLLNNGKLYSGGRFAFGQLGTIVQNNFSIRKIFINNNNSPSHSFIIDMDCGEFHSACINNKNELFTWGANDKYQLGTKDNKKRFTPTLVAKNVKFISCGTKSTTYIHENNLIYSTITSNENGFVLLSKLSNFIPNLLKTRINQLFIYSITSPLQLFLKKQIHFNQGDCIIENKEKKFFFYSDILKIRSLYLKNYISSKNQRKLNNGIEYYNISSLFNSYSIKIIKLIFTFIYCAFLPFYLNSDELNEFLHLSKLLCLQIPSKYFELTKNNHYFDKNILFCDEKSSLTFIDDMKQLKSIPDKINYWNLIPGNCNKTKGIFVHEFILQQLEYFNIRIFSFPLENIEKETKILRLHNLSKKHLFILDCFINYLYSFDLNCFNDQNLIYFFILADYFQFLSLKQLIENLLCDNISDDTIEFLELISIDHGK